ncbi:MAG: 30S ribosomal protein S12 methylthiotransferase RimO [Candidatus Metalachnospira sp.]|nr:30S ribosomal protein S12 methylthiotransferase RimO [Candidatus Metalachnospira sp.]
MKANIAFVSLGCDKNRVDSEVMLGILREKGYTLVADENEADIIVVNTCCFIKDALEESIETIIEMSEHKNGGRCKGLIVAGCLAQRYEQEIFNEMPEVDAVIGTTAYESVAEVADRILNGEKNIKILKSIDDQMDEKNAPKRIISTAGHYAYLKISEGCDNHCTYCVIPKMRGKHRSRTIESLIEETKVLAEAGVKELLVVAQDTSIYGRDLYGEPMLHELLKKLCEIDGIEWIRLLYCYAETLTAETIRIMAEEDKICKYIDIPIQHGSDTVLKRMGRRTSSGLIEEKIEALRAAMPDICIRTTIITGFPSESEKEFNELVAFVEKMKFDKLGVFTYSPEEGTPAAGMENQIEDELKVKRMDYIMELQKRISAQKCDKMIGATVKVIVDGRIPEDDVYCGRSYKDAPDIDGMVFFKSDYEIMSGEFADVKINEASDYDLIGEAVY